MNCRSLLLTAFLCLPVLTGWTQEKISGTLKLGGYECENRGRCIDCDYSNDTLRGSQTNFACIDFLGMTGFVHSRLHSPADFRLAQFHSPASFQFAQFHSTAYFLRTQFNSIADFHFAQFGYTVDFNEAQFHSIADFLRTQFNFPANFSFTRFRSTAYFHQTQFYAPVNFYHAQFDSTADFSHVRFHSKVDFSNAIFLDVPRFLQAQLPDTLVFTEINLNGIEENVDFREFVLDSLRKRQGHDAKCRLYLDGISPNNLAKLIIPFNLFELDFPDSTYVSNATPFPYAEKEVIYETVIKKCRDVGMMESVQGWSIAYQKFQNEHEFGSIGILFNWLNETWWNFGYAKWRILYLWTPFFFIVFCLINYLTLESQLRRLYFDPTIGQNYRDTKLENPTEMIDYFAKDRWEKLAYTLHYTGVIFFGIKVKHEALNFRSFGWVLYFYLVFIVGILHLAFSFNYIVSR